MEVALQTSVERTHLGNLIESISVAMLTTFDSRGALISCPMAPLELCEEGAIWFLIDANSEKLQYLKVLNLSFSDVANGVYVSLSGYGEKITDRAHIKSLWTPYNLPWFPDGTKSSDLLLLKFKPESAEYWNAQLNKMEHMFGAYVSVVAKKPIDMIKQGSFNNFAQA